MVERFRHQKFSSSTLTTAGSRPILGQDMPADRLIDTNQADSLARCPGAAFVEAGDIDFRLAQHPAEIADKDPAYPDCAPAASAAAAPPPWASHRSQRCAACRRTVYPPASCRRGPPAPRSGSGSGNRRWFRYDFPVTLILRSFATSGALTMFTFSNLPSEQALQDDGGERLWCSPPRPHPHRHGNRRDATTPPTARRKRPAAQPASNRAAASAHLPPESARACSAHSPRAVDQVIRNLLRHLQGTFSCASLVEAPRCGVQMISSARTGDFLFAGSTANTSSPAPPTCPLAMASAKSSSTISPPRAQLMIRTPGLHLAKASLFRQLRVLVGQRRVDGDEIGSASSSSNSTFSTPSSCARSGSRKGSKATTFFSAPAPGRRRCCRYCRSR